MRAKESAIGAPGTSKENVEGDDVLDLHIRSRRLIIWGITATKSIQSTGEWSLL